MPRSGRSGGGGGSFGGRSRSSFGGSPSSRSYSTGRPSTPPSKPTAATGTPGQPAGPGLFKQAAATAAGVAAGSVLASAILGAGRDSIPDGVDYSNKNSQVPDDDPCAIELRNFIDCAYGASEITQCDGFNTLLKECRRYTEKKK